MPGSILGEKELRRPDQAGGVPVLDVRLSPEQRSGHNAGVWPIPMAELRRHLHAITAGVEVVACCRAGPVASQPEAALDYLPGRAITGTMRPIPPVASVAGCETRPSWRVSAFRGNLPGGWFPELPL